MTPPPAAAAPARTEPTPRPRAAGPRRVSGPARPAVARAGGAVAAPPLRRVRQPQRRSASPAPAPSLAEAIGRLCDSRLLDRLMRGRFWIGVVAFALIGIVAMQLALLKMNTGIGRDLQRESLLQRQNADMEAEVSGLASVDRVQAEAAQLGMVAAAPGSTRFLAPGSAQIRRAAGALDAWLSAPTALGSAMSTTGTAGPVTPGTAVTSGASSSSSTPPSAAPATATSSASAGSTAAAAAAPSPAPATGAPGPASTAATPVGPSSGSSPSSTASSSTAGGGASAPVGG